MSAHLREAWGTLVVEAMSGPIYRGYQVTLPPDLREFVDRHLQMPMETHEINQHLKIGPRLIDWLQRSHPNYDGSGLGLGRHWTTSKDFADKATFAGNISGNFPILLTAQYDESGVDHDFTLTTELMAKSESEVTLLPGARVTVTNVELPGQYGTSGMDRFLDHPIQAKA